MGDTDTEMRVCDRNGCDTEFEPYRDWQRFCCDTCRVQAHRDEKRERAKREILDGVEDLLDEVL